MESALYGIYALVFVSEILLVRCAHSFDFWCVNNSCVNTVRQHFPWSILYMFFVSHLYFGRVKRPSSGWMAVTSITHHYNMITNKSENLHTLQRKINTRALLPDARPSRPILAVTKVTYIQALRLNTVQPIGPLAFFIPESWFFPGHSVN